MIRSTRLVGSIDKHVPTMLNGGYALEREVARLKALWRNNGGESSSR
jgi:hypothetical protein